jgi:YaaC-like protein
MSPQELISFRYFQDITPIPILSSSMMNQNAHFQKLIDALNPYFSVHYYDDNRDFDLALPYQDMTHTTPIPMNEALAIYVAMFCLSSLVRYRPSYLEALLNHTPAWLIENFLDSTPELFLRIMVSEIIGKDFVFRRR